MNIKDGIFREGENLTTDKFKLKKKYDDLAKYAVYFDVCTIPFLINEITVATNPLKVFEYMALGIPTVCTRDLCECEGYEGVLMSKNDDEFIQNIKKAIERLGIPTCGDCCTWHFPRSIAVAKFGKGGIFAEGKYERIVYEESDKPRLEKAYEDLQKFLSIMITLSNDCFDTDSELEKSWNLAKFGALKDKSDLGMEIELRKCCLGNDFGKALKGITRFTKNGAVKMGMRPGFPRIEFKRKLYLKKLYKDIDRDLIYDILDSILNEKKFYDLEKLEKDAEEFKREDKKNIPKEKFLESIKKEHKPYYVSTRMLNKSNVKFPGDKPSIFTTFFKKIDEPIKHRDTMMIYLHGGGFVGMSTFPCEIFLRKWANELDIPILGINYSLAPQNRYPAALNDVWQAYHWIQNNATNEFGIIPKRIILAGDSAGGNLALALTFLLIATKQKVPDLLLGVYPTCGVDTEYMNPSFLKSFDELFLNPASLIYSSDSYLGKYGRLDDCFLNPHRCPEMILKNLPKTRFFLADWDPLRDAAIKLSADIAKTPVDFKAYEFDGFPHGFLKEKAIELSGVPQKIILEEVQKYLKDTEQKEEEIPEYVSKDIEYPPELLESIKQDEENKRKEEERRQKEEEERKRKKEEEKKKKEEEKKKKEEEKKKLEEEEKKKKEEEEKKK